jgi:hypothetical protein
MIVKMFWRQRGKLHAGCATLEMSVPDVSTIVGGVSLILNP